MNERTARPIHGTAPAAVPDTAVVVMLDHQVSTRLGDETVILHVDDGVYYGLDPVGTTVWRLLQEPRTVAEIRDRIVDEYDVDAERCERDLAALLRDLAARRLITVSDAEPPRR